MRKFIWKVLRFFKVASFIQISYKGILDEYGWLKSFNQMQSIDKEGNPIPWFSYSAISFINDRLTNEMTVFEFGSGNSTLWFSKRVKNVVSIEHDVNWYNKIKKIMPENVNLSHCNLKYNDEYCRAAANQHSKFDIIIIDGRDRNNCVLNSIDSLADDGIIIFDNMQRKSYQPSIKYLDEKGFSKIDFIGLCPCVPFSNTTTIFYKSSNCFKI